MYPQALSDYENLIKQNKVLAEDLELFLNLYWHKEVGGSFYLGEDVDKESKNLFGAAIDVLFLVDPKPHSLTWYQAHFLGLLVVVGSQEQYHLGFNCDFIINIKLWEEIKNVFTIKTLARQENERETQKALLLDRDGVIIKHIDHLHEPHLVELNTEIINVIKQAMKKHFKIIVVTNQSGIGRGLFSKKNYQETTDKMLELLSAHKIFIDKIYYASFYAQSSFIFGRVKRHWRKPRSGMILQAIKDFNLKREDCVLIGDRESDLQASIGAQIGHSFLWEEKNLPLILDFFS